MSSDFVPGGPRTVDLALNKGTPGHEKVLDLGQPRDVVVPGHPGTVDLVLNKGTPGYEKVLVLG